MANPYNNPFGKTEQHRQKKFIKFKQLQSEIDNDIDNDIETNKETNNKSKQPKSTQKLKQIHENELEFKFDHLSKSPIKSIKSPIKSPIKSIKSPIKSPIKSKPKSKPKKVISKPFLKSMKIRTSSYRSLRVPGHRMIHVRRMWKEICNPIIKQLKLQIRMNSKKNLIELRIVNGNVFSGKGEQNVIQKGSDFIRAIVLGFEIKDALALIRMDNIFLETFDIRDVKFFNKKSDHWMRAIGRIAGQYGKIKYSIENSTNTRIVIFGFKVHILGSYSSIRLARNSISRLVIGSSPGNVYAKLKVVSNRLKHKF